VDWVDEVVSKYKIYAICTSLQPDMLPLIEQDWERKVVSAGDYLKSFKPSVSFVLRFENAVRVASLVDGNIRLSDAISLCAKNKKAIVDYYAFDMADLTREIQKAVGDVGKR